MHFSFETQIFYKTRQKLCSKINLAEKGLIFFLGIEATSENTCFGVHEWNKIWSYTQKSQIFYFFYAFIYNN